MDREDAPGRPAGDGEERVSSRQGDGGPPPRATVTVAPRSPLATAIGLAGSVLAHGAVAALVVFGGPLPTGGEGVELEAVGIEVTVSAALESLDPEPAATPAGAAATVAPTPGEAAPIDQPELAATEAMREIHRPPPPEASEMLVDPEAEATQAAPPAAEPVAAPEPTPAPVVEQPPPPRPEPEPEPTPAKPEPPDPEVIRHEAERVAQQALTSGGATALATSGSEASSGSAAASPGEVSSFSRLVRDAIGRKRPRHRGVRGKVTVSFALAEDGTLSRVAVARSSGREDLDTAALDTVRRVKFPTPPAGLTLAQRSYSVQFEFK